MVEDVKDDKEEAYKGNEFTDEPINMFPEMGDENHRSDNTVSDQEDEDLRSDREDEDLRSDREDEAPRSDHSEEHNEEIPEESNDERAGNTRYNLRSRKERNYNHSLDHTMDNPGSIKSFNSKQFLQHEQNDQQPSLREAIEDMKNTGSTTDIYKYITGFIMTQMTIDTLFQEFLPLHGMGVFLGQDTNKLTNQIWTNCLRVTLDLWYRWTR